MNDWTKTKYPPQKSWEEQKAEATEQKLDKWAKENGGGNPKNQLLLALVAFAVTVVCIVGLIWSIFG